MDWDRFTDVTGGDEETMRELIELFYRQTTQQLSQIESALQTGNAEEVRRVAHSCAGASATLGMVRLVPLLRTMEKLGAGGNLNEVPQLFQNAKNEFKQIQLFLATQPGLSSIQAP
jgi:HPt (histidine-containing phosphotransfer) domain-containing protein